MSWLDLMTDIGISAIEFQNFYFYLSGFQNRSFQNNKDPVQTRKKAILWFIFIHELTYG